MPLLYTNCGSTHEGAQEISSSATMKPVFKNTFHPFLQTNCASCHVRNGSGNGKFASASLDEAYLDFYYMGYSKISEYALSPSHNYPFTGPQHEEKINLLINQYREAMLDSNVEEDSNIFDLDAQYILSTKLLGFNDNSSRRIVWKLSENMVSKSNTYSLPASLEDKIRLEAEVSLVENVTGQIGYAISSPKLSLDASASTDVMITGAVYNLNESIIKKNTFYSLKKCIPKGESGSISESGSIFVERKYQVSDRIGLAVLRIEETTCPKPDELPKVSFVKVNGSNSLNHNEGSIGDITTYANRAYPSVEIKVSLDKAPKLPVYVGVILSDKTNGIVKPRCCITVDDEPVNRGDWDFDFNRADLVFYPPNEGENAILEQSIIIPINDDERPEADEILVIELDNISNAVAGDTDEFRIKIVDAGDPIDKDRGGGFYLPNGTWFKTNTYVSYSKLYNEVFNSSDELKRCIGCHNSRIQAAGYDVTNYKQMLQTGVVKPMNRNGSDLVRRIVDWNIIGLNPMPLNRGEGQSGTSPEWHRMLESWINNGARNN